MNLKKIISMRDKIQRDREAFDIRCKALCHPTREMKTLGLSGDISGLPMVPTCRIKKMTK